MSCCAQRLNASSELSGRHSPSYCEIFPEYRDKIILVSDIIAFRNQIVHGYANVRDDIVWEIVQVYLPRLHEEVVALLEKP
jgi:uncharacterized protein with HEPN domain